MKTEFKDVAHLYLGVEVVNTIGKHMGKIVSVSIDGTATINPLDEFKPRVIILNSLKPILRPLSDITNDEFYELSEILEQCDYGAVFQEYNDGKTGVGYMWQEGMAGLILNSDAGQYFVKIFPFLLSRSFDLFGLIESGEAINKAKLSQNTPFEGFAFGRELKHKS